MKVASVQMERRKDYDEAVEAARAHVKRAVADGAELVLLPEYWFMPQGHPLEVMEDAPERADALVDALRGMSRDAGVVLAGNVVHATADGARVNVAHAFDAGRDVGEQAKLHPMPGELQFGMRGGKGLKAFDAGGHKTGLIVCADIMYPEVSRILSLQGAEILLNPVMSPYRENDVTKDARDALFIARAWDAAAFVLKAGAFWKGTPPAVGRSLITAPWGVLAKYKHEWDEEILFADLDFDTLREFRESQRGFQDRRPEEYAFLAQGDWF